jgi:hypothetical protein
MNREFKFRHANEIAGLFVIGAVVLFVLGIVFAGRSQGWFEPRFTLNVVFDTAEGSFGLQEGAPVMVRNTQAGRVGPVLPTEDGLMGTTLVLKERFRPFITTDSIAKIKKKFGVAGDAYVDIARGHGEVIADEAYITCEKDEELIETAQKMLAEVQTNIMPILSQAEAIITSVASILDQVDTGKGVAGAAIGDSEMRDDITAMVANLEAITANAEKTIGTVDTMMSNDVARIVANVGELSARSVALMDQDVPRLTEETLTLQGELTQTLAETRRVIEGLQRHWLLRKYIKHDSPRRYLVPTVAGKAETEGDQDLEDALALARQSDNPEQIRLAAYNLAVEALANEQPLIAEKRLQEIRFSARLENEDLSAQETLLAAEIARQKQNFDAAASMALDVLAQSGGRHERILHAEASLLLTAIYAEGGNLDAADASLKQAEDAVERVETVSPLFLASLSGLKGQVAEGNGDVMSAAAAYATQAALLRDAGRFAAMTRAQTKAASLYSTLGLSNSSATYYLRAASALLARGEEEAASELLAAARIQADFSGDELLIARISDLSAQLSLK